MAIVEDHCRLDLALLRRSPHWKSGHPFRWTWSRWGAVTCSVAITRIPDRGGIDLEFDNGTRRYVAFDETPARFGGVRQWFCCPRCARRCRVIDDGREGFGCRRCYGRSYRSEYEKKFADAADRSLRRARAIVTRLGGEEPEGFPPYTFPPKPQRMHWTTYWAQNALCVALQERAMTELSADLRRMTNRSSAMFEKLRKMQRELK